MDPASLTLFFPCFNDARTIGRMVAEADRVAAELTDDYELIVVDDGSRDASRSVLGEAELRFPRLRVIEHPRNLGYGAAVASGFRNATRDWVFYTDGDGQYDVNDLRGLLQLAGPGVDLVNGYKRARSDPWYRIVIGSAYLCAMRALFRFRIRDLSCDFRLVRRGAFDPVALRCHSGAVCLELVTQLERVGLRTRDCPVSHYRRPYGNSEFFRLGPLWLTALEIFSLWRDLRWKKGNISP